MKKPVRLEMSGTYKGLNDTVYIVSVGERFGQIEITGSIKLATAIVDLLNEALDDMSYTLEEFEAEE